MYFPDLSCYSYGLPRPLENVVNIGWLDCSQLFPTGAVPLQFKSRLYFWLELATVNRIRGFHECNLCRASIRQFAVLNGETVWLGAAEMWIPSSSGRVFAAPDLLVHYVEQHAYKPPADFVEAVLDQSVDQAWIANESFDQLVMAAFRS